jgi:hypothetical protein
MSRASSKHFELRRILGPWIRDLRTGQIERRDSDDVPVAYLSRVGGDCKEVLDRDLVAAGFILIDLPGGCTIEEG